MAAISRNKTKIYITTAGTNASAIQPTDLIEGEIKSYSKTGGETDTESEPVFGGYVDKEKPQTQFELEFEIVPSFEKGYKWEQFVYNESTTSTGFFVTGQSSDDKTVFIEATDDTKVDVWGFNNCNVTVLDMEHNADDNQTKTMTLKFGPTDDNGQPNYVYGSSQTNDSVTSVTNIPDWDSL